MDWLGQLIDIKVLIGFGVGVLTASLSLIPTLREHNQENAQNQKMKLSTKSAPSTQDLKQVYIKGNEKRQLQNDLQSNTRKTEIHNSIGTDKNQQDYYSNLDDGIRKKIKIQKTDEESSSQDVSLSQSFNQNEGSQNFIQQNNTKAQDQNENQNENENEKEKEKEQFPSPSRQQDSPQIKVDDKEPLEELQQNSLIADEPNRELEDQENIL